MPFKSQAQARYFNANRKKLEAQGVDVDEWNKATDFSHLANRAGKSTSDYAEQNKDAPGKKGKRARRTLAFMGARH